MSYTPPISPLLGSWAGQQAYRGATSNLPVSWSLGTDTYIALVPANRGATVGRPSLTWDEMASPAGIADPGVSLGLQVTFRDQYIRPNVFLQVSWWGADPYAGPAGSITASWANATYISVTGINPPSVGEPILFLEQFATPVGIDALHFGANVYALYPWEYAPPEWVLDASWVGRPAYSATVAEVDGHWTLPSEAKTVPLVGWESSVVSDGASLLRSLEILEPAGFVATEIGLSHLANKADPIRPAGIAGSAYGRPTAWNWLQYSSVQGFNTALYGVAYLQGGVKYVTTVGINALDIGRPSMVNTTANQNASPKGIQAPPVGSHHVSPRSVFPFGILSTSFGSAFVQFPPRPVGWLSSAFGYPFIEYKTKQVRPSGISADEAFGYPVVFDPTQRVLASTVIQSAVFGDTAVKNTRFVLKSEGFDSLEFSAWASLESNRREVTFNGFVATEFGNNAIRNKTPSLSPEGFDSLRAPFGIGIGYAVRRVYPSGADFLVLGRPKLTQTPSIAPKGFTGAVGHPTVWPRVRTLEVKGRDSFVSGFLDVWFRFRIIQLEGRGVGGSSYGSPRLDHQNRDLLAHGSNHSAMGSVKIGQRNRTIAPKGIWEEFATGHMVGGLRFLRPVGYEDTRWGTRIIPEITDVYPLGFANSYGLPTLRNRTNLILPAGITTTPDPVDKWGTAKVWNSTQTVEMFYDVDSDLNPPKWPQWTLIENRDKVFRVTGTLMSSIGRAIIANKATPLLPASINAPAMPSAYKAGMVAFRIRPLRLEGIESPYMSTWSSVFNDAAVIAGKGFDSAELGTASLENTRRSFRFQGWQESWFGHPMVAFRIRHIEFEGRYTIAPPPIRMPEVKLYTRYLEPIGYDTYGSGSPSLSIHWRIITPRWAHRDLFGEPRLHNVTPEVATRGRASDEHGTAFVRLEWRDVKPYETFTQIIPKPVIAFRDRSIAGQGFIALKVSDKLVVTGSASPPYTLQYIILDSIETGESLTPNCGIEPPLIQVPFPEVNQQVLYPESKLPMTKYGTPTITANSIRVEPGINELNIGKHNVSILNRQIDAQSVVSSQFDLIGKPRVSPHTIWCTWDVPQQAINNHPGGRFQQIRGHVFGRVKVENQHRLIKQHYSTDRYGNDMARVGIHNLINKLHFVYPSSFNSFRSGWHSIPSDKEIIEHNASYNGMAFGRANIVIADYNTTKQIKTKLYIFTAYGKPSVELFNREVLAKGFESLRAGTKITGDKPYMWQGLRIGELMPTIPEGFHSDLHGTPWVSFRVREANIEGFDAFMCEYDIEKFIDRMKVTRREVPNAPASITPEGFDSFISSAPNIKPMTHFIRPDGNSDQYRKGAF